MYKRMLRYLTTYWPLVLFSIFLSFLVVIFEALSLWFGASLVQTLFDTSPLNTEIPDFNLENLNEILKYWTYQLIRRPEPIDSLKIVCVLMASTFLAKNILVYLKTLVMAKINLKIVRDMRNQLFAHAMKLPVPYYDKTKSGNIISLILNDVSNINASMTGTFDKLFIEPMRVLFFITTLFIINIRLTLAIFVIFPLLGFLIAQIGKVVRRRSKRVLEYMAGLLSILHETISGIRAVKMFNMNEIETEKFKKENQKFIHHSYRSTSIGAISSPLTEILGVVVVIILLWYGGSQVLTKGGFGAEDFVRFLIFLFSTFTPLKTLTNINNTLQRGFAAAERVFSLLDSPTEPLGNLLESKPLPKFENSIEIKNVTFSYPQCSEIVLNNLSFTIKKGSIVALVGSSGAGKSTILDLLPRFYDIKHGSILIDGKDIGRMDIAGLRNLFGIVSQETVLFNETIFNNIAYGFPVASVEMVTQAAYAANAWEFIEKLPEGLNTIIGERGVMLSGGQRQRISIARALLRNPPVLILDEATSALDTESEQLVQAAINNLIENRTALIVAHRLSTIRNADMILVLENGSIIEKGSHEDLLALNKRYKYFHDIQFAATSETSDKK
ncbi:MAG: ATP-binding cassette domain-containing protein [Fibrobacter sp.]|nr:ATP-binding cassette domain-containing protein [Fibrobacter sp.]